MATLNREQLNKILELMLENQADDPGSMLVVDSDKNEILEGRQELGETTEGLTRKRNDVDFGGRKARKEAENREFITKGFGEDVLDQDGNPILDEKGLPKKSRGYFKQRGNVFRFNTLDGTIIGSEITVNQHEKLIEAIGKKRSETENQYKTIAGNMLGGHHEEEITATKSMLIANMVEDTKKAAAKKLVLTEPEMEGMQMVFDMHTKNIIAINPYDGADVRCFDVSTTLDKIDSDVTSMFSSADEEEVNGLIASMKIADDESKAIAQLDSDISRAMIEYEQQLAAYKEQSTSSFASIKKAMLRDNVAPETVDERMKALKVNIERLDKIANLERYVAQTKAIQMKESLDAQEKATEMTRAELDKIENKDTALLYSAIKEGNTVFSQFAMNINQGFNDLLVNLKDQEVIDKAKANLAKAQKEYKSYLNRIGELVDKRLAKVKELKEKQSKQMDNLVQEAEKAQDTAYKERIKELKGSYSFLPSWLGGKTGLEKEIISTMADQSKAMASAQLESIIDVSSDPNKTEILVEKMRLRQLEGKVRDEITYLKTGHRGLNLDLGSDENSVISSRAGSTDTTLTMDSVSSKGGQEGRSVSVGSDDSKFSYYSAPEEHTSVPVLSKEELNFAKAIFYRTSLNFSNAYAVSGQLKEKLKEQVKGDDEDLVAETMKQINRIEEKSHEANDILIDLERILRKNGFKTDEIEKLTDETPSEYFELSDDQFGTENIKTFLDYAEAKMVGAVKEVRDAGNEFETESVPSNPEQVDGIFLFKDAYFSKLGAPDTINPKVQSDIDSEVKKTMQQLYDNAEKSLLARNKLTLLAELELMSPAMNVGGKLQISNKYKDKLEVLNGFFQESTGPEDQLPEDPTPEDLVIKFTDCYESLQKEIRDDRNLALALTGSSSELTAVNLQEVAKQASAITEAEVAQASISRDDAQQITDAAMAELLEEASEVGINLTALTENNGDNRLFNKLKDATIKRIKVDDEGYPILKADQNGKPIPVKDSEGHDIYNDYGPEFEFEEEEVRIFPEGVVGLVKKGELDFLHRDRRYWSNVSTKALNAAIGLLNGLIKMVNFVLSEQRKFGEWSKYTLPYQEITAAQLADVFQFQRGSQEKLINKGVDLSVFALLNNHAVMVSKMQDALAITTDKDFVTHFSDAVRGKFDPAVTANPQIIEAARKRMHEDLVYGKGEGKERFKGLKESVSAYAYNRRLASEYGSLRNKLENTRGTKDTKESIKKGDLDRLNNTEGLVRGILRSVPLSSGTTLDSEFTVDADADANTIIAAARKLVTSNTTDGKIGRADVDSASVMKQLDGIQIVADNTAVLNHSKEEEAIKTAKKNILKTLTEMENITNESTEADCLQKIKAALPEIKVSLDAKLVALPEAVRDALAGKSIDERVEEKFGAMWRIDPWKYLTTKDQMRNKVVQEVLATANAGTVDGVSYKEEDIKQVEEVLQLQSMQEDLIGIQQEIMRNNDLMRASTKASVENKSLHDGVKALYEQALETFPDADFDPSSLESEYKGKKMTVNKVDKDKKYISMPTRMIPVFVKALQEANLDGAYKAARQAVTEAQSAVASQEQTITGLEEKRTEAQAALEAAQQEHDAFPEDEKVMPINDAEDASLLQNDAQNPQPTPQWQAVMDRLEAAEKAVKAAVENVNSEQTKLTALVGVAKKAETKLDDDFDKDKIETYQKALTAMSTGLDSRTQAAVEGFKQHKERKDTITTRVKKAGDLMKKLQSSPKPSTPSVSPSDSSGDHELGLDDNNPNSPGK